MTREEAIQALNEIFDDSEFSRYVAWYGTAMNMAIEALSEPSKVIAQISVDTDEIVKRIKEEYEIVQCKDCKHRYEEGDCTHYYWCRLNDRPIDDTDFCSWAERREP